MEKLADARRCPCAAVPKDALCVDGGTSSDASDAVSWLKKQKQWNVLAYEPVPRNCKKAYASLARFSGRGSLRCSALSNTSAGPVEFVDEEDLGDAWGSLSALSGVGASNHVSVTAGRVIHVNVTTLDLDVQSARLSSNGVYLLKRASLACPLCSLICSHVSLCVPQSISKEVR